MKRLWLASLLLVGCASDDLDRSVTPSISTGMFGQLTSLSDLAGRPARPFEGLTVTAYLGDQIFAMSTSDADGVYELRLDPGSYNVRIDGCVVDNSDAARSCVLAVIIPAAPLRQDWQTSIGGGFWCHGMCPN